MSIVSDKLGVLIDRWSGVEAGTFGSERSLASLWASTHGTAATYSEHGIDKLLTEFEVDKFFKNCARAQELSRGHLDQGGSVQKYGDLLDFMRPCNPPSI